MTNTKLCEYCGEVFTQSKTEGPKRFRARRFCSDTCGNSFRRVPTPAKTCAFCGAPFERDNLSLAQFATKECCSPKCHTDLKARKGLERRSQEPKYCVICGTPFIRRPKESYEWFANRTTCGDVCGRVLGGATNSIPWRDRLWDKVSVGDEDACWEWLAYTNADGYGVFRCEDDPQNNKAYRAAWMYDNGPIPEDLLIRHLCNNPPCCNPKHLALGTKWQNSRDMVESGRALFGERCSFSKLTNEQVIAIRTRFHNGVVPITQLAAEFQMSVDAISDVVNYKTWSHI